MGGRINFGQHVAPGERFTYDAFSESAGRELYANNEVAEKIIAESFSKVSRISADIYA
jgi:hypothetical protein